MAVGALVHSYSRLKIRIVLHCSNVMCATGNTNESEENFARIFFFVSLFLSDPNQIKLFNIK